MWRYLKRVLIGKPLKTLDEGQSHLTKFKALAMLSSDALSSVAYGTEQITTVLVTLSTAAIWYSLPIAGIVLVLLLAITLSYRQIIHAYPSGGGAYVVATKKLGEQRGPNRRGLAASRLHVDGGGINDVGDGSDHVCNSFPI